MWFTENAWAPMLVFACLSMIAAFVWIQRQQSRYLVVSGLLLSLVGMTWMVNRWVETDREKVTKAILEMTNAFAEKDRERMDSHFAQRATDLKSLANFAMDFITVENMRVTDIHVLLLSESTRAISRFRVNALFRSNLGVRREPTLWEARWQQENGAWKMVEISQLNPITQEVEVDFSQLHKMFAATRGHST